MGTNFYLVDTFEALKGKRPIYIGKRSFGWAFMLHYCPPENLTTLGAWINRIKKPSSIIQSEYGEIIPAEEMVSIITSRPRRDLLVWDDYQNSSVPAEPDQTFFWCYGDYS